MDEFLASLGRIAEKLPLPFLIPALAAAAVFYAWQRATKEDARRSGQQQEGQLAKVNEIKETVTRIEATTGDMHTSIEVIKAMLGQRK